MQFQNVGVTFLVVAAGWAALLIVGVLVRRRKRGAGRRDAQSPEKTASAPSLFAARTILRMLVIAAIALAAGGPYLRGKAKEQAVIVAVDVSLSISPAAWRDVNALLNALPADARYAVTAFAAPRSVASGRGRNRSAVRPGAAVVFNALQKRGARPDLNFFEAQGLIADAYHTDLAAGIRHARGLIPPGVDGHVVLVTDGLENRGDGVAEAAASRAAGITVHGAPVGAAAGDFVLERFQAPARVVSGEPVALEVVVGGTLRGEVELTVRRGDQTANARPIFQRRLRLIPGRSRTVRFSDRPTTGRGFVTYEARIAAETAERLENNIARAVVRLTGPADVLVVSARGAERLRSLLTVASEGRLAIRTVAPRNLTDAGALREAATVVLDDVARGDLSAAARQALAAYVTSRGGGLLVLGGPHALGAGGWRDDQLLPRVLPLSMRPRETKRAAVVFVLDRSASMGMSQDAGGGRSKLEFLQDAVADITRPLMPPRLPTFDANDEIALVTFNEQARIELPPTPVRDREAILAALAGLSAKGRTDIVKGLRQGFVLLRARDAKVRHLFLLSDGIQSGSDPDNGIGIELERLLGDIAAAGLSLTSVGIGRDKNWALLKRLKAGRGQAHADVDIARLKEIIREDIGNVKHEWVRTEPFRPRVRGEHEITAGLPRDLPVALGRNRTAAKPQATVLIDAAALAGAPPAASAATPDPILAVWRVGLGRAAVLATSAGEPWMPWLANAAGAKALLDPTLRWLLKRTNDPESGLTTRVRETEAGRVIAVDARDSDGRSRDLLRLSARVTRLLDPNKNEMVEDDDAEMGQPVQVELRQTGLGRYEAPLPARRTGLYRVEIFTQNNENEMAGPGRLVDETVHAIGYPDELRRLVPDRTLLARLADAGGGRLIESPGDLADALRVGAEQRTTVRIAWLFLLLAAALVVVELAARAIPGIIGSADERR